MSRHPSSFRTFGWALPNSFINPSSRRCYVVARAVFADFGNSLTATIFGLPSHRRVQRRVVDLPVRVAANSLQESVCRFLASCLPLAWELALAKQLHPGYDHDYLRQWLNASVLPSPPWHGRLVPGIPQCPKLCKHFAFYRHGIARQRSGPFAPALQVAPNPQKS